MDAKSCYIKFTIQWVKVLPTIKQDPSLRDNLAALLLFLDIFVCVCKWTRRPTTTKILPYEIIHDHGIIRTSTWSKCVIHYEFSNYSSHAQFTANTTAGDLELTSILATKCDVFKLVMDRKKMHTM